MRNYYFLAIITLIAASCKPQIVYQEEVITAYDTVIAASDKLHDSVLVYIPNVDKKIEKLEKNIAHKVDELKKENESLKKEALIVKTITVRDTVYIKEKTNFWGKRKITTDSSSSIDSTIIENDNK